MDRREAITSITTVLGYTMTPASIISLSNACTKPEDVSSWTPLFFKKEEAQIIERLGEMILPGTETPGSIDVGAHIFVDEFLERAAKESHQEIVRKGFDLWQKDFEQRNGKPMSKSTSEELLKELSGFFDVDEVQQSRISSMLGEEAPQDSDESKQYYIYSFLMRFKRLLMLGYYASEQVGENVLSYLPVPGRYDGCIPADEVGNAWAL